MLTCEALKGFDVKRSTYPACGAIAIGLTSSGVRVCPDCADDDLMQIENFVHPFPIEYLGEKFEPKKLAPELRTASLGPEDLCVAHDLEDGMCQVVSKPSKITLDFDVSAAEKLTLQRMAGEICSSCDLKPATGILGLCADCAPDASYTPDDIEKYDKPGDSAPREPLSISDTKIERPPIGIADHTASKPAATGIYRQLDLPIAESGPIDLIRQRAADWERRSMKWHHILNTERKWTARGVAYPTLIGAVAAVALMLDALHVLKVPYAQVWPAFATLIVALVGVRANHARVQLDANKAGDAWVSADRMAEHYRGLLAEVEHIEGSRDLENSRVLSVYRESQKLEASARFGVPDLLQKTLAEVVS